MTIEIADDIGSNYNQLRRDRGWSWDQMADSMARTDPLLAKWMREQSDTDDEADASTDVRHEVARSVAGQMVPDDTTGPIDRASIHQEMPRLAALLDADDAAEAQGTQSNGEPPEGQEGAPAVNEAEEAKKAAAEKAAADAEVEKAEAAKSASPRRRR